MKYTALLLTLALNAAIVTCNSPLESIREWKQLDFQFPNNSARQLAIQKKHFIAANTFPIDVDCDYRGSVAQSRIIVTMPRFNEGVPITLGFVTAMKTDLMIKPFPNYEWHASYGANCDGITSVFRVMTDSCGQLWVLDSGVIGEVRKCPPQLLVFNMRDNDRLVLRYKFPKSQYVDDSLFITPVLDVNDPAPFGTCKNVKVYIADVTGFALIVYDSVMNKSWKIKNKLFEPDPKFGSFRIAGESFELMDGLFGMAVSPRGKFEDSNFITPQNERKLYFHALASGQENAVPLRTINDPTIWASNVNAQPSAFKNIGMRNTQTAAEAMDSNGNLYFVLINPLALACWDTSTPFSRDNIKTLVTNNQTLQFASGVKVIRNLSGVEELWAITNRFQKIFGGTLNFNEVNFRIQVKTINELLRGNTRCNGGAPAPNFSFPAIPMFLFP